ncbi:MAG: hypothetical protein H7Y31_14680, partial [Chitinophagaceae bacterium]|nr:hypothetical protein [Chitinophagaceae bacterium]
DATPVFINKNVRVHKSHSPFIVDSLKSISANEFVPLGTRPVIFHGYDNYYYTFQVILQNDQDVAQQTMIVCGGHGKRVIELWKKRGAEQTLIGRAGYAKSFNQRPYPFLQNTFPVTVNAATTDTLYFITDESHAYKTFSFLLVHPKKIAARSGHIYLLLGFLIGLLVLFAVMNLYLYFSLQEKIHLWYALYIVSITLFLFKHDGLDAQFLGLDSEIGYRSTSQGALAALSIGLLTHVVHLFVGTSLRSPVIRLLLVITKWSCLLSSFVFFIVFLIESPLFIEQITFEWSNKSIIAAFIAIVAACVYSIIQGFRPALFILIGLLLFIAGGISRALFLDTTSYIFPPTLFQAGLIAEAIVISFGLMYRYNQFKKQNALLNTQLDRQQRSAAMDVLHTQQAEQKRIARDLHDQLGGNLAAIKMTAHSFSIPKEQSDLLIKMIDNTMTGARNIAHDLMPPEFEQTPLKTILASYYQQLSTEGRIRFHFHSSKDLKKLPKNKELMIYRILMELTSNIIRHSDATEATIQLIQHDQYLELMAEDNGKGFDTQSTQGIGLQSINNRVTYLEGKVTFDAGNSGTTVIIELPTTNDHA